MLIAETGRIPVDNPATHLELTMIHEAMVLEYAGPDLALVEWASAVKELLYITLLVDLFMPVGIATTIAPVARADRRRGVGRQSVRASRAVITLVESTNAKLRLFRVPELVAVSLGSRVSRAGDPIPVRSRTMTPNVVILCAAGMLVSAYLMVGQKSLFTTIRLYGVQSLLLATVAVDDGDQRRRVLHLFVMAGHDDCAEGVR